MRNQYPGLVKEWATYKDWETKFAKYYKKQLEEILGLSKFCCFIPPPFNVCLILKLVSYHRTKS